MTGPDPSVVNDMLTPTARTAAFCLVKVSSYATLVMGADTVSRSGMPPGPCPPARPDRKAATIRVARQTVRVLLIRTPCGVGATCATGNYVPRALRHRRA